MKKLTTEDFIEKAKSVHGDKYDYSLTEYIGSRSVVSILCNTHGTFQQSPDNHINKKNGCPNCFNEKISKIKLLTNDEFIRRSKKKHGDKYDYSLVQYENTHTKVSILCLEHGSFNQYPHKHIMGEGCVKCYHSSLYLDNNSFIERAKKIHSDKYDYSLVDYKNSKDKIKIICPKHGIFLQSPVHHLLGCGCPENHISKGEESIKKILDSKNVDYVSQYKPKGCVYKKQLRFDFYLPNFNLCIEYDGAQHYKSINIWGGEKSLMEYKKRDSIKEKYCRDNNIQLLRITYIDNNIEKKLKSYGII